MPNYDESTTYSTQSASACSLQSVFWRELLVTSRTVRSPASVSFAKALRSYMPSAKVVEERVATGKRRKREKAVDEGPVGVLLQTPEARRASCICYTCLQVWTLATRSEVMVSDHFPTPVRPTLHTGRRCRLREDTIASSPTSSVARRLAPRPYVRRDQGTDEVWYQEVGFPVHEARNPNRLRRPVTVVLVLSPR